MKQPLSGMIYAWKNLTAVDRGLFANLEDVKTDRSWSERKRGRGCRGDEEKWGGGSRTKFLRLSRTPSPFHKGLDRASRNAVLVVESRQEEKGIY